MTKPFKNLNVTYSFSNLIGSTVTWTRIVEFRVLSANHYTMEPCQSAQHDEIRLVLYDCTEQSKDIIK